MLADTARHRSALEAIGRHVRRVQQRFRVHPRPESAALALQQLTERNLETTVHAIVTAK